MHRTSSTSPKLVSRIHSDNSIRTSPVVPSAYVAVADTCTLPPVHEPSIQSRAYRPAGSVIVWPRPVTLLRTPSAPLGNVNGTASLTSGPAGGMSRIEYV